MPMSDDYLDEDEDAIAPSGYCLGVSEAVDKVVTFVRKIAANPDIQTDVEFCLFQYGRGSTAPINRWVLQPGEDPDPVGHQIVDAAREDGEGTVGRGKIGYIVTLTGYKGRVAFKLEFPRPADYDEEGPGETATTEGALALSMRQNDQLHRRIVQHLDSESKFKREIIRDLREDNNRLRDKQVETIRVLAELYDGKARRDLEIRREDRSDQRKDELMSLVTDVGMPLVLGRVLGQGVPNAKTPFELLAEGFVKSLKREQMQALLQMFSGDQTQVLAFAELLKTVHERDQQAQQHVANANMRHAPTAKEQPAARQAGQAGQGDRGHHPQDGKEQPAASSELDGGEQPIPDPPFPRSGARKPAQA